MSDAANGTLRYRVEEAERDIERVHVRVDRVEGKLNTLIISVIGLALSIAGSAVIFAVTVLTTRA